VQGVGTGRYWQCAARCSAGGADAGRAGEIETKVIKGKKHSVNHRGVLLFVVRWGRGGECASMGGNSGNQSESGRGEEERRDGDGRGRGGGEAVADGGDGGRGDAGTGVQGKIREADRTVSEGRGGGRT
jgi:hypothetical protein